MSCLCRHRHRTTAAGWLELGNWVEGFEAVEQITQLRVCFPEYLPGNKYAGVIGAGSWFAGERPDDGARQ